MASASERQTLDELIRLEEQTREAYTKRQRERAQPATTAAANKSDKRVTFGAQEDAKDGRESDTEHDAGGEENFNRERELQDSGLFHHAARVPSTSPDFRLKPAPPTPHSYQSAGFVTQRREPSTERTIDQEFRRFSSVATAPRLSVQMPEMPQFLTAPVKQHQDTTPRSATRENAPSLSSTIMQPQPAPKVRAMPRFPTTFAMPSGDGGAQSDARQNLSWAISSSSSPMPPQLSVNSPALMPRSGAGPGTDMRHELGTGETELSGLSSSFAKGLTVDGDDNDGAKDDQERGKKMGTSSANPGLMYSVGRVLHSVRQHNTRASRDKRNK